MPDKRKTPLPLPRTPRTPTPPPVSIDEPAPGFAVPSWRERALVAANRVKTWVVRRPYVATGIAGFFLIVLVAALAGGDAGADADVSSMYAGKAVAADEASSEAASKQAVNAWVDEVQRDWSERDLSPGGFAAIEGKALGGGVCRAGAVSGIDVTLCDYPDLDAAESSRKAGLGIVGDATGAAVVENGRMLVVADRKGVDPSGRSIQKIIDGFRKSSAPQ